MDRFLLPKAKKLNKAHARHSLWQRVVSILSAAVVFCTTYALILPAITLEREPTCGMEEHVHGEECWLSVAQEGTAQTDATDVTDTTAQTQATQSPEQERILVCQLPEHIHEELCYPQQLVEEPQGVSGYLCNSGEHTHGQECLDAQGYLTCTIPEHTHQAACLLAELDLQADVETREQWEAGLNEVVLSGNWPADVLAIAQSQLGYEESRINCVLVEGQLKGYTRYGNWLGDPYGDWNTAFALFVLHYAGVQDVPTADTCPEWTKALEAVGCYQAPEGYTPKPGDLIFLDYDQRKEYTEIEIEADQVGVVSEVIEATDSAPGRIRAIQGGDGQVSTQTYEQTDPAIVGFCPMPAGKTQQLTYRGQDFTVTVQFGPEAGLPQDTALSVREILPGTEEYDSYYQQSMQSLLEQGQTEEQLNVSFARFFDISFLAGGQVLEPVAPVDIRINYDQSFRLTQADTGVAVHFAQDGIEVLDAQTAQSGEQTADTFAFTQDSFSVTGTLVTAAARAAGVFHVWFDGTNGDIMSLYGSDNTYQAVDAANSTITLPETWKSPAKYAYTLKGWYDIVSSTYYPKGATVTITQNAVFYADWVAASYDVGIKNSNVVNSLDTNDFITTHVFDYNALFNMQSLQHQGSVSASGHSESWSMVQSGKVPYNGEDTLFFSLVDYDSTGQISYASNRGNHNNNQSDITYGVLDIVRNASGKDLLDLLFDPDTQVLGKHYVGTGNYLYQYMDTSSADYDGHDGYYYLNSTRNAASYNQSQKRFYLYDYLERTSDSEKDGGVGEYSDFLPFNSPYVNTQGKTVETYTDPSTGKTGYQYDAKDNGQNSAYANAGTNYWFGIRSDIQFFLPNNSGEKDIFGNYGNISTKGQHMVFEFQGDDDVWVFVDGKLMLDVGGVHGVEYGQIDFSTGTVSSGDAANPKVRSFSEILGGGNVNAGAHTMTVYYMERGSSQSNCMIYFNVAPNYSLELQKQDVFTAESLEGTEFTIYTNEACTQPAQLWTSQEAYRTDMRDGTADDAISTIRVENGYARCWGISAGKTYYIKETKSPPGYPATDDCIRVTLNNRGTASIETSTLHGPDGVGTEGFQVVEQEVDNTLQAVRLVITNEKADEITTQFRVLKDWHDNAVDLPESVQVYLTANGQRVGRMAVLTEENGWSYTWTGLPYYSADGTTPITYDADEVWVSGYKVEKEDVIEVANFVDWLRTSTMADSSTYLLVNNDRALSYTGSAFAWVDPEAAKSNPAAQWTVATNYTGFRLTNGNGYSITFNGSRFTASTAQDSSLNQVLYFSESKLMAQHNDTYYLLSDGGSAGSGLTFTLYRMDVLNGFLVRLLNTPVEPEKQSFLEVKKVWADDKDHSADSVTMFLHADGKYTGMSVRLSAANGWEGSFEGLPYYGADGVTPIVYTAVEEPVANYHPIYSELTEEPGREFVSWTEATALTTAGVYRISSGSHALATTASGSLTSKANDLNDPYQQWRLVVSGSSYRLQNVGSGYYLRGTTSSISTVSGANSASSVTVSGTKLRVGSRRYLTLSASGVSSSSNSTGGTELRFFRQDSIAGKPGASMTVTNTEQTYALPETGGIGNHWYTVSGLLIIMAVLFCGFKPKRKARRT